MGGETGTEGRRETWETWETWKRGLRESPRPRLAPRSSSRAARRSGGPSACPPFPAPGRGRRCSPESPTASSPRCRWRSLPWSCAPSCPPPVAAAAAARRWREATQSRTARCSRTGPGSSSGRPWPPTPSARAPPARTRPIQTKAGRWVAMPSHEQISTLSSLLLLPMSFQIFSFFIKLDSSFVLSNAHTLSLLSHSPFLSFFEKMAERWLSSILVCLEQKKGDQARALFQETPSFAQMPLAECQRLLKGKGRSKPTPEMAAFLLSWIACHRAGGEARSCGHLVQLFDGHHEALTSLQKALSSSSGAWLLPVLGFVMRRARQCAVSAH